MSTVLADGGGRRPPTLTPRQAYERWLSHLRTDHATSTVSAYKYRLKKFVEWTEEQQITDIGTITGWDIETYETHRRAQDNKPVTLHNDLDALQQFFEYCARIELVPSDLPDRVDPPKIPPQDQVNKTRLTTQDAHELLAYYSQEEYGSRAHTLLAIAWYTGARLGGLRALDIDHYDPDDELLEFTHRPDQELPLKNGIDGERIVGIPRKVCEIITEYIKTYRDDVHDDYGIKPLITSQLGRASTSAIRGWMYLATVPCLHSLCPHGKDPDTCDWLHYQSASQCPSSRSPHQVRSGSITWQLNLGIPVDRVAERVNASVTVLKRHYDVSTKREKLEERRRQFVNQLKFNQDHDNQH